MAAWRVGSRSARVFVFGDECRENWVLLRYGGEATSPNSKAMSP